MHDRPASSLTPLTHRPVPLALNVGRKCGLTARLPVVHVCACARVCALVCVFTSRFSYKTRSFTVLCGPAPQANRNSPALVQWEGFNEGWGEGDPAMARLVVNYINYS